MAVIFDPPLKKATLLKRYKRFLADIELADGSIQTIHCPNTGAMTGCAQPGWSIWYSTSDNPKRKYPHTWEISENSNGQRMCINTSRANQVVIDGLVSKKIPELADYQVTRQEVRYGEENSRIDLLLTHPERPSCYVEIKTVTLLEENGCGFFPDTVTTRGQKHLRELITQKQVGDRAVLFFLVQHEGIQNVQAAEHIDPTYANLLREADDAGVEILCYRTKLHENEIIMDEKIPFIQ